MVPFESMAMLCTHLKLPAMWPGGAEGAELQVGLAIDGGHLHVGAIGDEDVALGPVLRQHQVPHRAVLQRLRLDLELLHEGAVLLEHLDAVVSKT